MSGDIVQTVGNTIARHADEIAAMFKPGAKVTIYVRNPGGAPGEDMLISSDDIGAAIEAMRHRHEADDSLRSFAGAGLPSQEGTA